MSTCLRCGVDLGKPGFLCGECRSKQDTRRKRVQHTVNEAIRKARERLERIITNQPQRRID